MSDQLHVPREILAADEEVAKIIRIEQGRHYQSVYRIDTTQSHSYILKIKPRNLSGNLQEEGRKVRWLQNKAPVPRFVSYYEDDTKEYLCLTYIEGEPASDYISKDKEESVGYLVGRTLRELHQLPINECPFNTFTPTKLVDQVEENIGKFPEQVVDTAKKTFPNESLDMLMNFLHLNRPPMDKWVFTHGDYGTGNVIIRNGKVEAFIDLDGAGISDPYYDIYYMIESLTVYSHRHDQVSEFLRGYGIKELDWNAYKFHHIVDTLSK